MSTTSKYTSGFNAAVPSSTQDATGVEILAADPIRDGLILSAIGGVNMQIKFGSAFADASDTGILVPAGQTLVMPTAPVGPVYARAEGIVTASISWAEGKN